MSETRELYESLSSEFVRKGIASNRFSELEKLYHFASDNEKIQPEWRKLNIKTIKSLTSQLEKAEKKNTILTRGISEAIEVLDSEDNPVSLGQDILEEALEKIKQMEAGECNGRCHASETCDC